jgi:8-oxo-dGTP diphosphatase
MQKIQISAALIIKKGNILFAKRAKGELAGFWEFPGGKIEKGETSKQAIIREIKEELNLDIKPIKNLGIFTHKYDFAEIEMTLFECEILEGEIRLDGSHTEYKWVDIKNNNLIHTPMDKEIIQKLKID